MTYLPVYAITDAPTAPPQLRDQLPIYLHEFTPITDTGTTGTYWLAQLHQPIMHRLPDGFDIRRSGQHTANEDHADRQIPIESLAVYFDDENEPYPGMQGLPVDIFYVLDNTLKTDSELDAKKIELISPARISDTTAPPITNPQPATTTAVPAQTRSAATPTPRSRRIPSTRRRTIANVVTM